MLALKTTPFHARTSALMQGNQWRRWAGHTVASAYELTTDRETAAIRNACVVIDVSALFKYRITGKGAHRFLDRLVTRDLSKMEVGHMAYTPWCNARGKVIDDGTIARLGETEFRLTSAESNLRWLQDHAEGFAVAVSDESDALGTLALQGPTSRAVLEAATGADLSALQYHRFTHAKLAGESIMISRTGYTGDLGYELWIATPHALPAWDALLEVGSGFGLQPAGIWAMDVARIEAGLIMLDVEYVPAPKTLAEIQTSSPYELGLGWAVHLKKSAFVGKRALAEEKQRGPGLVLVGIEIDHAAFEIAHEQIGLTTPLPFIPWREVVPLFRGEQVGHATCGTWSPTVKKYIALAQVAPAAAAPGTQLTIDLMVDRRRVAFAATVVPLPFFKPERKTA